MGDSVRVRSSLTKGKGAWWRQVKAWAGSLFLHSGLIAVAVFGLPMLKQKRVEPSLPITVDFVRIGPETALVEPEVKTLAELEASARVSEPEKTEPDPEPAPVNPVPETEKEPVTKAVDPSDFKPTLPADPQPVPDTAPDAVPLPAPEPAPKPEISEAERDRNRLRTSVTPALKPQAPSRVDTNRLAALIDKSKKEAPKIEPVKKDDSEKKKPSDTEQPPRPQSLFSGSRSRIATAGLRDALARKLSQCWNFPGGAKGVENFSVVIRIYLRLDGSLARAPEYIRVGDLSNGFYRAFAESALRAVRLCEPFDEAESYVRSGNSYIDFNFDGSEFGG